MSFIFFLNHPSPTEIYTSCHTLSLHDALPIWLFRQHGYAATGLNELVEASGSPKGSMYHYFPDGKPSIATAAVEEAGRRVVETLEALAADRKSTRLNSSH